MNAQTMSREDLKGKFKTLTSGQKGDSAINQMVSTYINLCQYADWTAPQAVNNDVLPSNVSINSDKGTYTGQIPVDKENKKGFDLNYDIHIHLPATRDAAV